MTTRLKTWRRRDLLVEEDRLRRRCRRITALSHAAGCVPLTEHMWEGNMLVQRQEVVPRVALPSGGEARVALNRLAADLDALQKVPIHGDITLKNVVFDGRRLFVVDWEPSHHQIREGRKKWMVSEPWVALADRRSGVLSTTTDRIGIFAISWQMLHRPHGISNRRSYARAHHLGRARLVPVEESALDAMSYADIVALAASSRSWRWKDQSGTWA